MLFYLLIWILWYYIKIMRNTIKKHKDFLIGEQDINARCAMFFVRARPARIPDDPQYGLIVTKKIFKLAVNRNRAKRMLRDWIRYNEKNMCADMDYIFIARMPILATTRTDGRAAMRRALHYIKKQNAAKNTEK